MKKVMLIVLAFVGINVSAMAQSFDLGIKAGLNNDKFITSGFGSDFHPYVVGGVFMRLGIASFFIEPELLYVQKGGTANIFLPTTNQTVMIGSQQYLEVPLLIGKRFAKIFRFEIGPSLDYLLATNEAIKSSTSSEVAIYHDVKSNYHKATVGYQVGVGLDIFNFGLDLRYDGNLAKVVQATGVNQVDGFVADSRSGTYQLTLSFKLL